MHKPARAGFYFMHVIAMALMGLFAFTGTPVATLEASETPVVEEASVATTTLAIASEARMVRNPGNDSFTVKLTSYNAVAEQTDRNPSVTASGAHANPEVVAARSVDLAGDLPFGTIVALSRATSDSENCRFGAVEHLIGYRVIADSMHSRKRAQIDVLLDQTDTVPVHGVATNPSLALGLCSGVDVRVVGKITLAEIPTTQEALRQIVEDDTFALR